MNDFSKKRLLQNISLLGIYSFTLYSIFTLCTNLTLKVNIGLSFIIGFLFTMLDVLIYYTKQKNEILDGGKPVSKKEIYDAIESLRQLLENDKLNKETLELIELKLVSLLKEV